MQDVRVGNIAVLQDFIVLRDGEELAGLIEWRVHLSRHSLDTFALWHESAILTLVLEDGRQLQGFLDGDRLVLSASVVQA